MKNLLSQVDLLSNSGRRRRGLALGVLLLSFQLCNAQSLRQEVQRISFAADNLQYVTIDDPAFGVVEGKMPFFRGWHGTAVIDRSDPAGSQGPRLALSMVSPDETETVQIQPWPIHTSMPMRMLAGGPPLRMPGFIYVQFDSTADLLTRYALPSLHIDGRSSVTQPFAQNRARALGLALARAGIPGAFTDSAGVLISGLASEKESFLYGITSGSYRASRMENSSTSITVVSAPFGKAMALAQAVVNLPEIQMDPAWQQREMVRSQNVNQRIRAADARNTARIANDTKMSNASNAAARARQQGKADASTQRSQQDQQSIYDKGEIQKGIINGQSVHLKWCNGNTGEVRWTTDSEIPPGPGYQRCN